VELNDYQERANRTDQRPVRSDQPQLEKEMALVYPLMGMSSEVGSLLTQYKKHVRDGGAHELFSRRVSEELGDVLWYVSNLAAKLGFELEDIAVLNLERINERWPAAGEELPARLLDEEFPEDEQLPRQVEVRFEEAEEDGRAIVRLWRGDEKLGNDVTDMNYDPDGYRFHDVFHLSYAALLGWSPVSRFFFSVKRESNRKVREIEDGGRAVVIEEAISASIFEYARKHSFLEGIDHVDSELLYNVKGLASHLEVRMRTIHEWEQTILRSYEIWRQLREHRAGTVRLDLKERTIDFRPPET
jgi:NTP pyrophosphatase (non-canonical NTP hydrolase)